MKYLGFSGGHLIDAFCLVWMCLGWHLKKDDFGILDFAGYFGI